VIPPYGPRHRLPDDSEDPASQHPFRFHGAARRPLALLGVRPANAFVFVDAYVLHVRFGPWSVTTPAPNVLDAEPLGALALWRTLGMRCSTADRALTFGTDRTGGLRIRFREPVHRFSSRAALGHPELTVTLEDPEPLLRRLAEPPAVIPPTWRRAREF
jgi:hypothetical protein